MTSSRRRGEREERKVGGGGGDEMMMKMPKYALRVRVMQEVEEVGGWVSFWA